MVDCGEVNDAAVMDLVDLVDDFEAGWEDDMNEVMVQHRQHELAFFTKNWNQLRMVWRGWRVMLSRI